MSDSWKHTYRSDLLRDQAKCTGSVRLEPHEVALTLHACNHCPRPESFKHNWQWLRPCAYHFWYITQSIASTSEAQSQTAGFIVVKPNLYWSRCWLLFGTLEDMRFGSESEPWLNSRLDGWCMTAFTLFTDICSYQWWLRCGPSATAPNLPETVLAYAISPLPPVSKTAHESRENKKKERVETRKGPTHPNL